MSTPLSSDSKPSNRLLHSPVVEEIRFAVVMYGGISLCIYMNGIMQQLLALVRSTARGDIDAFDADFYLPWNDLTPIEQVYRKLAKARTGERSTGIDCRFVVDILSGTSAGGLNNMFLARALANDESVEDLTRLWIEEGDISRLLNDRESSDSKWGIAPQKPPESLLNSGRMAQRLLQAMRSMEKKASESRGRRQKVALAEAYIPGKSPYVRRLDLYMTASDLEGLDLSLKINDDTITERRHRAVFHFVYDLDDVGYVRGQHERRNDFVPEFTPFFTFVARATSSIVPAFEPIRLSDIGRLVDPADAGYRYQTKTAPFRYSPFFRDYWSNSAVGVDRFATGIGDRRKERAEKIAAAKTAFVARSFGDGGYGDNYPFGYAIDEVTRRSNDFLVDRKLVYVEPDPSVPGSKPAVEEGIPPRPNALGHMAAASTIKSTETIRQDIDRLRERNGLLDRVESIRANVVSHMRPSTTTAVDAEHNHYYRLRAASATDDLSVMFTDALGFERSSIYEVGIRAIVKSIRFECFKGRTLKYLDAFDFAFLRRKISYHQKILREVWPDDGDQAASSDYEEPIGELKQSIATLLVALREADKRLLRLPIAIRLAVAASLENEPQNAESVTPHLWRYLGMVQDEGPLPYPTDFQKDIPRFVKALARIGKRVEGKAPFSYQITRDDLFRLVEENPIELHPENDHTPDHKRVRAAWELVVGKPAGRQRYPSGERRVEWAVYCLERLYFPIAESVRGDLEQVEEFLQGLGLAPPPFETQDEIMFPVLYGAGNAESSRIDILRISPVDCKTLVGDPREASAKLAGTGLGHFSGFFKHIWRAQDILWGRLDGAERLICTVMPSDGLARRYLIFQAQLALLAENDLDEIIAQMPGSDKIPEASGMKAFRAHLLNISIDSYVRWVRTHSPQHEGGIPDIAQRFERDKITPALRKTLIRATWEDLKDATS